VYFYGALRKKYSAAGIYLLGNDVTKSIYQHSTLIDVFLDNPLAGFIAKTLSGKRIDIKLLMESITELVKTLASERFNLLFNLQVLPMTAVLAKLASAVECIGMTLDDDGMPLISGNIWAPYLFGVSANLMRSYNRLHRTMILQRLLDSADVCDVNPASFITQKSVTKVQSFFDEKGIKDDNTVIGLCPTSNSPFKTWKKYDLLMHPLWKKYGAKIILFGSPEGDHVISEIIKRSGVPAIKAAHFNLNELMAAISGCDLFITNDTGPMHLASLLNRRIIALFGPTSIREVGPWSRDYIALQSTECQGCFQTSCDVQPFCMDHISVQSVLEAVDFLQKKERNGLADPSSPVTWFSPLTDRKFFNDLDEFISKKYLRLFEPTGSIATKQELHRTEDNALPRYDEMVVKSCKAFKAKALEAVKLLENRQKQHLLREINKELSTHFSFLKNIIVLNDMKFLDKRLTPYQDVESWKRYYTGLIDDAETFMASTY
jgi:ADP-heptose:LPS heptosyltransferase